MSIIFYYYHISGNKMILFFIYKCFKKNEQKKVDDKVKYVHGKLFNTQRMQNSW